MRRVRWLDRWRGLALELGLQCLLPQLNLAPYLVEALLFSNLLCLYWFNNHAILSLIGVILIGAVGIAACVRF